MQETHSWALARKTEVVLESAVKQTGILSFSSAFIIRLVPEILAGPWPLGFDTITYYTPAVMNWSRGEFSFNLPNFYAPLLYFILFFAYLAFRNIFMVLKLFGPLLYGLLSFSFFFFVVKGLNWSPKKGLFAASLFSFYFITLRISWDLYRNMLGLIFLLLLLPFLHEFEDQSLCRKLIALTLAIFVSLSHELVAVIMFLAISVSFSLKAINHKQVKVKSLKLFFWFVPSLLVFALIMYFSTTVFHEVPGSINYFVDVQRGITYGSYNVLAFDVFGLFLLSYGPLLPFAILGFLRNRALDSWLLVCLMCSFWPLVYPQFEVAPWNRWMYMLDIPLIVYATNGLVRLQASKMKRLSNVGFSRDFSRLSLFLVVIGVFGFGYMALPLSTIPPQNPWLQRLSFYIPAGMLSNTFPTSDNGDLDKSLRWVNERLNNESVLIIHESLTGWANLYLDRGKNVINYRFRSHLDGLQEALSKGYKRIYLIWWIDDYGWYGQKSTPKEFGPPVFVSSRVGVYLYENP